jgi:hypothetical protein
VSLTDYDAVREKVARVQQRLNADVNAIRSNGSYSDAGRKREMAKAVLDAKNSVAKIRDQHVADRTARRDRWERLAFGMVGDPDPQTLIAIRDAQDRAERITSEQDAAAMLHRATQTNDATLASAIGLQAYNRGWSDVTNTWANTWDKAAFVEEFKSVPGGKNTNAADALVFRVSTPQELAGTPSDSALKQVAEMDVSA